VDEYSAPFFIVRPAPVVLALARYVRHRFVGLRNADSARGISFLPLKRFAGLLVRAVGGV
jgi:hypothetical protein